MGANSSKTDKTSKSSSFVDKFKSNLEEEINRRTMLQREVQMAVNIASARDSLNVFGSVYVALVTGLSVGKLLRKPIPGFAAIPVLAGGVMLGNMADMAYGNKLARINKEAEFILDNERPRLVPFPQAPMARFYSQDERALFYDPATAVGDIYPYRLLARSLVPRAKK